MSETSESLVPLEVARQQLNWPFVALALATEIQVRHVNCGAAADEATDEFVVRQALREALIRLLGAGLVSQYKEVTYPDGRKRMDLELGAERLHIAIEIKSDPSNVAGVKSDCRKLCDAAHPYKMMVFAGVVTRSGFQKLEQEFVATHWTLDDGTVVHEISRQKSEFGQGDLEPRTAFAWLWYIGDPLPKQYRISFDASTCRTVS